MQISIRNSLAQGDLQMSPVIYTNRLEHLKILQEKLEQQVKKAQQNLQQVQKEMIEAQQKVESLNKHKEKLKKEHDHKELKEEEKQLNELALIIKRFKDEEENPST